MSYYAVIFTSRLSTDTSGYEEAAERMLELAAKTPGFLGVDSARDRNLGITISYWESLAAIDAWRRHPAHCKAKDEGKSRWYESFTLRIAKVDRPWMGN